MSTADMIPLNKRHPAEEQKKFPSGVVIGDVCNDRKGQESVLSSEAGGSQDDQKEVERTAELDRNSPQMGVIN